MALITSDCCQTRSRVPKTALITSFRPVARRFAWKYGVTPYLPGLAVKSLAAAAVVTAANAIW